MTLNDIAIVCGVTRDTAKMWDWTGQLPQPEVGNGIQKPYSRGWEPEDVWAQWCHPTRGMTREQFDQGMNKLHAASASDPD